jgi:redox-sensitive bicupin YhaK (pirin superfamily)
MTQQRHIVFRKPGTRHGPNPRVIRPGDVAKLTKPFVFLDYVNAARGQAPGFGFHPHSGIATLTHPLSFDVQHETSDGQVDVVHSGGVEWVAAGKGVWHKAQVVRSDAHVRGFQLWFSLPPSAELGEPTTQFVEPGDVPESGPVRVLLGRYQSAVSPVMAPLDANYFWVRLSAGERWTYTPPPIHQTAWMFVQSGEVTVNDESVGEELAVFERGNGNLEFEVVSDCSFLLGSAAPYEHDLVLGNYSVHTSPQSLAVGERRIQEIGAELASR